MDNLNMILRVGRALGFLQKPISLSQVGSSLEKGGSYKGLV